MSQPHHRPPRRPASHRASTELVAAAVLATGLALGCQNVIGIHDVSLDKGHGGGGGSDGGGGRGGGGGAPSTPEFTLAVGSGARIVRGSSASLAVAVTREPGFTGAVTVALTGLPTGVTATSATIEGSATTGTLTITAGALAALGAATASLTGAADGGGMRAVPVSLLVADPPGTLDETFDKDGISTLAAGMAQARAIAVQTDGRIVVGGSDGTSWILARLLPDGSPDPEFGMKGIVKDLAGSLAAIALQPDGRILAAGDSNSAFALVRFNQDGSRDQAFGANGLAGPQNGELPDSSAAAVAVQSTGRIVLAGSASRGMAGLLLGFSKSGKRDSTLGQAPAGTGVYTGLAVAPDDSLFLGGTRQTSPPSWVVLRLHNDGRPDTAFGSGGAATLGADYSMGLALALQADGKPVIGGFSGGDYGASPYALARFTTGGKPDTTFGMGGLVKGSVPETPGSLLRGAAVQKDGKLLGVAGGGTNASGYKAAVVRYLPSGAPDMMFGQAGQAVFNDVPVNNFFNAIAVQGDGRIVAAGYRSGAGILVVRVWD